MRCKRIAWYRSAGGRGIHSMSHNCDICVIEDDASSRRLMVGILTRAGYECLEAEDVKSGWGLISQHRPKVIVSDWELPGKDGLDLCHLVRESPELAATFFIMVTVRDDPKQRAHALESGVDDYLTKPVDQPALLARVRTGIRMWDVKERLRQAAVTDGLTGLYNHDHLKSVIELELKRSRRYGGRLSLVMMDLDFFKAVNDTYGHLVGNDTLVEIARLLRESVRDVDVVGRFGGEEFVIVLPEAALDEALTISERIRHAVCDTLNVEGLGEHKVTASFGVATADDARVRSAADLVDLADRALYAAKSEGRNRVTSALDVAEGACLAIEGEEVDALRKQVAVLGVQAKEVYVQTVASLLQALEEKDPFTAQHSLNVAYYAEQIARTLGLNEPLATSVRNAGLLHDIGKIGIPDRILLKPSGLTEVEGMVMRQVPAISVRIIDNLRILDSEMHIIRHQGECFDGSGYPDELVGEQIPIGSRVLLTANAFDAMTTDRVYRTCRSIGETMEEIHRKSGTQFDPQAAKALQTIIDSRSSVIRDRIRETVEALRIPSGTA